MAQAQQATQSKQASGGVPVNGVTVTDKDRQVHQQIAREAADLAAKEAAERATIAKAKALLGVLAAIQPAAPGYGDEYPLVRMGQRGKLTSEDIERARQCVEDRYGTPPRPATLAECVGALRALARMPRDYMNPDKTAVQLSFPDGQGKLIPVTLGQIEAADALMAAHGQ